MNKLLLTAAAALLVSQGVASAQTTSGYAHRDGYVSLYGSNAPAARYDGGFQRDVNSTRSLLEGTASGKGSGPGAGSPNGN